VKLCCCTNFLKVDFIRGDYQHSASFERFLRIGAIFCLTMQVLVTFVYGIMRLVVEDKDGLTPEQEALNQITQIGAIDLV